MHQQTHAASTVNSLIPDAIQSLGVSEVPTSQSGYPPIGPEPLLLSRNEVDELYNLLEVLSSALKELKVDYMLTGGSLLGAVRSKSILFNDNNIDIAIIDEDNSYSRLKLELPNILCRASEARNAEQVKKKVLYHYQERGRIPNDRVVSTVAPRVAIDIFILRKFDTIQELAQQVEQGEEEEIVSKEHIRKLLSSASESSFPIYHYDNRKAILLKPNKYYIASELRPLRLLSFGFLKVYGPSDCIAPLERFYGDDCFTHYTITKKASTNQSYESYDVSVDPSQRILLSEDQYYPVQHSRKDRRLWFNHSRKALEMIISEHRKTTEPVPEIPTSSEGMARTRSLFKLHNSPITASSDSPVKLNSPHITTSASEPTPTKWFGFDVRRYIGESPATPVFDKDLRAVMEPHLAKARRRREECRNPSHLSVDASIASSVGVPYTALRDEKRFLFDESTHPLHHILAQTLGVDDLSQLHKHPIQDKLKLLSPLLTRTGRRQFQECYDSFVTSFCIPLLHSLAMTKNAFHGVCSTTDSSITYRYQAFPCIRVARPGEFSIEPHCDTAYGHSIGNLNFHIPLTSVFGTNALYTESYSGKEDWHGLTAKSPGLGFLFDGARCLHFTLENTTDATRVSIDFRIAFYRGEGEAGELCTKELLEDRFSKAGPGYYDEASIAIGAESFSFPGAAIAKKYGSYLLDPDARVGFPFTKK